MNMEHKLTEQQIRDIELIKPWALRHEIDAHPQGFDTVQFYTSYKGINIYKLWNKRWNINHKMGYPKLVMLDNGIPTRLNIEEVKAVIASFS